MVDVAQKGKSMTEVLGPGQIGQAIARRIGFGKHVLLADKRARAAGLDEGHADPERCDLLGE